MRYAIITDGVVANIIEAEAEFADSIGAIGAQESCIGDLWDGEVFSKAPPPALDPIKVQADIVTATQAMLDDFAKTRNYDSIMSAATYATSTVPKFAAEGQYAVDARDQTWSALYTLMGEVLAGTRPMPTGFAEVAPLLPALAWPA